MKAEIEMTIREIGARGDGVAILKDDKRLYIPYTVPGDRVRVRLGRPRARGFTGTAVAFLAEGPGRNQPPCHHFGTCGGCALQHLEPQHYRAWKLGLLTKALARQKVGTGMIRSLFLTPPGSRRRADFTAFRREAELVLGYNARFSHRVIDLIECPVLCSEIVALLGPLRELLFALLDPGDRAEAVVTQTDSGLDVLLVMGGQLDLRRRERLAAFADEANLARVSCRHPKDRSTEVIVERRTVRVHMGEGMFVSLPPGGFLQASEEGEASLRQAIQEAIGAAQRVADLYAGCGTFALPLAAEGRQVYAVEGDRYLVEALKYAVEASAGRLRLSIAERDLRA